MKAKTWKDIHILYMHLKFKEKADEWAGITSDDRLVYCNMYKQILDALDQLPDEPCNYVCVAMNHKFREDRDTMMKIKEVFKDR